MATDLELVGRLRAFELGRAIRASSQFEVAINPDSLVLCPIAMAGEDTTIHIVAFGKIGSPPRVEFVPDPRMRIPQRKLFADLGETLWGYFLSCRDAGTYPQLWVSNSAVANLIDTLSDALRNNRIDPMVRRFGECIGYATERYHVAGQQALVTATGALRAHFLTGQTAVEDEHLGNILTWIHPPPAGSLREAIEQAGKIPMGAKTDPAFDKEVLEPLLRKYHAALRRGGGRSVLDPIEGTIRDSLRPVVEKVYEGVQEAIRTLLSLGIPYPGHIPSLESRETEAFLSFMNDREAGFSLPLRDKPKSAAYKISEREDALKNVGAAHVFGNEFGRARAQLAGEVVVGHVANSFRAPTAGGNHEYRVEVLSRQKILRVRKGDRLFWLEDPRLCLVVTGVNRVGRTTQVSLRIQGGMRSIGLPAVDSVLELAPDIPDWDRCSRVRGKIARRLQNMPWTHVEGWIPPAVPKKGQPPDPLADLEKLRWA